VGRNAGELDGAEADVTTPREVGAAVRPTWPGALEPAGEAKLHVRRAPATSAAAEPAVLVHGLGGSATNWTDLMGLLQDSLSSAAPDLPGFGWSPPPPRDDYSLMAHVRVITDFIESDGQRNGHGPVHLLGNSLGGSVATLVAARRPDLVRTLTLVSPALPVLRPRATNAHLPALAAPWIGQRLARRLGRYPVEARVKATLALCFADPSRVPQQRFEEAIAEADRRARLGHESDAMLLSLRSLIATYLHHGPVSLWEAAGQVRAPTLLIYGLKDKLVDPRTSARAARTYPDAHLVLLPDCGHVAQMEHPEEVARAVRRHVRADAASRATAPSVAERRDIGPADAAVDEKR
jgi:pimeloyl-ACP methyl ester carboxylesterase